MVGPMLKQTLVSLDDDDLSDASTQDVGMVMVNLDANSLINKRAERLIAQSVRVRAAVSATMQAVNGIKKRLQKLRLRSANKAIAASDPSVPVVWM